MDIGIRRKVVIAMTKPCLDILQSVPQIQHDGRTAVAQIMEPNRPEPILLQHLLKLLRNKVRLEKRTHLIDTHKISIAHIIAISAQRHILLLALLQGCKILIRVVTQRQSTHAVFCLCSVVTDGGANMLSLLFSDHRGRNADNASLKVDRRPAQP
ncbi:hypothetical protein SDC9_172706 [bioreactor metagenome]|uniref:Uncharacterized protein n=1 Tax=bioreactor metagenome TaxID=1076179 RepID=A0A645GHP7_9ZZZZ